MLTVLGAPAEDTETRGFWIAAYLTAAVHGVLSPEVAGKIARHHDRFRDWMTEGGLSRTNQEREPCISPPGIAWNRQQQLGVAHPCPASSTATVAA